MSNWSSEWAWLSAEDSSYQGTRLSQVDRIRAWLRRNLIRIRAWLQPCRKMRENAGALAPGGNPQSCCYDASCLPSARLLSFLLGNLRSLLPQCSAHRLRQVGNRPFLLRGCSRRLNISSRRVPLFRAGHWTSRMPNRCRTQFSGWPAQMASTTEILCADLNSRTKIEPVILSEAKDPCTLLAASMLPQCATRPARTYATLFPGQHTTFQPATPTADIPAPPVSRC